MGSNDSEEFTKMPTCMSILLSWVCCSKLEFLLCGNDVSMCSKHAESTVLVMELLGESMSMLRVTPEAINGVPISKCVSVGLEMLDCIHAFHKHGYVHRDIKASNFALTAGKTGSSSGIVNNRYVDIG